MVKAIHVKDRYIYYLTDCWVNKEVYTFQKDISLKVNVIAWLEFEPVYFEPVVQEFSHYVPEIY